MKDHATDSLRNIALIGHGGCGKSSLGEAVLYDMKSISRLGSTDAGSLTLDYTPAEHKRKISLQVATGFGEWRDNKINILDTPGFDDFVGEVTAALHVADSALLVLNAVSGVEGGAERTFEMARKQKIPTLVCVSMMDKENADFDRTIAQAQESLSHKLVPLQLPVGQGADFKGLIDLFKMKAYMYTDASHTPKEEEIPAELREKAEAAREKMIEAVAEFDDTVIEKYLEGEALTDKEILSALRLGVAKGGAYPTMVASATKNIGIRRMLDTFVVCFPSPPITPRSRSRTGRRRCSSVAPTVPWPPRSSRRSSSPISGRCPSSRSARGRFTPVARPTTPIAAPPRRWASSICCRARSGTRSPNWWRGTSGRR